MIHGNSNTGGDVKLLELTWTSVTVQKLENVAADRVLRVREP